MDAMKKYGFFENRFFPAVFLLLSFAFLLVFSFSTSPLYAYTGFDSATFRTIGLGILQGKLPYADLFDHKGPLAFYFNAAGIGIIPGDWGIFLMQVLFMAVSAYLIYRTDCLFTDRKTAFICVLLLFFPFVDFIVEGNQCEEWMMPFVTLSVYLVLSWMMRGEGLQHSPWCSLFYGISFSVLFFIRPNDAVMSMGSIMLGVFLVLMVRKMYGNAALNVLAFLAGCAAVACPIMLYFSSMGILDDMLFGTVFYNIRYADEIPFLSMSWGIIAVCAIIVGGLIWLAARDRKTAVMNYVLIPYLVLTLVFIGKRDYWHYLIPMLPYVSLFFVFCLRYRLRPVVIAISVLFFSGSYYQDRMLVRNILVNKEIKEIYVQTDRLFSLVPEEERNSVWNHDMFSFGESHPRVFSLVGAYFHAGVTPGNRVFIPFHRVNFGEEETLAANAPEWVMALNPDADDPDSRYLRENYTLVASTDDSCPCRIGLYRRSDGTSEETLR